MVLCIFIILRNQSSSNMSLKPDLRVKSPPVLMRRDKTKASHFTKVFLSLFRGKFYSHLLISIKDEMKKKASPCSPTDTTLDLLRYKEMCCIHFLTRQYWKTYFPNTLEVFSSFLLQFSLWLDINLSTQFMLEEETDIIALFCFFFPLFQMVLLHFLQILEVISPSVGRK